ncbi:MAG: hypothetical protein D6724_06110 [Armatimonadetes bacterium]|nr:MAG: hypothetical protein D6724_06110 [Armatimonadota bacterium]
MLYRGQGMRGLVFALSTATLAGLGWSASAVEPPFNLDARMIQEQPHPHYKVPPSANWDPSVPIDLVVGLQWREIEDWKGYYECLVRDDHRLRLVG